MRWKHLPDGEMPIDYPALNSHQEALKTYFFGKKIYRTLGKEHVVQFSSYVIQADENSRAMQLNTGDENFLLRQCPKWASSE